MINKYLYVLLFILHIFSQINTHKEDRVMTTATKVTAFLTMLALSTVLSSILTAQEETRLREFVDQLYDSQLEIGQA